MSRREVLRAAQEFLNPASSDVFYADLRANARRAMRKREYSLTELEREVLMKTDWLWERSLLDEWAATLATLDGGVPEEGWRSRLDRASQALDDYWAGYDAISGPPAAHQAYRNQFGKTEMIWI